jgi:serine/threonine protein kinase
MVIALEFLSVHRVAHRDLKPDNILLDCNFSVKICDFGEAKIIEEEKVEDYEELVKNKTFKMEKADVMNDSKNMDTSQFGQGDLDEDDDPFEDLFKDELHENG